MDTVRGFHLYAALAGSAIVALSVGYTLYLAQMEADKIGMITEIVKRSIYIPFVDISREESFTAVSEAFRKALELYLRRFPVYIPREVYENRSFDEWVENSFLRKETTARTVASYLYAEIRSYASVPRPGIRVMVTGGREALIPALERAVTLLLREDSTILVFDPSKLSKEVREGLPKLKVCEAGYCKEVTVFPKEKAEITIPLRLKLALEKAADAYSFLRGRIDELRLTAGFCKEDCAFCAVFEGPYMDVVYPEVEEDKYCRGYRIYLEDMVDETGNYRAIGIQGGGCPNLSVLWEDEGKYVPCYMPEELLKRYYRKKLRELSKNIEGDLQLDESVIKRIPTKLFSEETILDIGMLTTSIAIPPELLKWLGIDIESEIQMIRMPGTGCKKAGLGYCAYPTTLRFVYTWTDRDPTYSVLGVPMEYRFLMDFGPDEDINHVLEREKEEVEYLMELSDETQADEEGCEEKLEEICEVTTLRYLLSSSCPGISGNTLEELNEWVEREGNRECKALAGIFLGRNGACFDPKGACERGISFTPKEKILECGKERAKQCLISLAELTRDICKLSYAEEALCTTTDWLSKTPVMEFQKFIERLISNIVTTAGSEMGPSRELSTYLSVLDVDPSTACRASFIVDKWSRGELSEECNKAVAPLLGTSLSPCTDPVGSCMLTSFRPVKVSSELCDEVSYSKLRSTIHYNIFDPSYMAVGCYAGNA